MAPQDRTVRVRYEAITSRYTAGVARMQAATSAFGRAAMETAQKNGRDWDHVATRTAAAGIAIGAGVGVAVKKYADFDEAMSAVKASTRSTGQELDALREAAIKQGAATKYSATEAAQGINEMAKAGVDASDILGGGLKGALSLAAAGQMSVADASELAATALTQFELKGSDLTHVADLYAAAAGKAQGSTQDIGLAMKYAGVTAHSMDVSIEETTGTLALFASKGIIGEQAGTSFRSMLMSLTSPSKTAQQAMDELGISVYDGTGKFIGMTGVAQQLHDRLGPLDDATRNKALGQLFDNTAMTAAISLYDAGAAGVNDWTNKVNDAGFAAEQAAALTDNLKGDVERLGGALDSTFIQTGSSANGALRSITQSATDMIDAFNNAPAPLQDFVLKGAAVSAAALIIGGGMIKVVTSVNDARKALSNIRAESPRVVAGLGSVGRAAAIASGALLALAVASEANDELFDRGSAVKVNELALAMKNGASATDAINKALMESRGELGLMADNVDNLSEVLSGAFDVNPYEKIQSGITGVLHSVSLGAIDIRTATSEATRQLENLDQAMATLVETGQQQAATQMFDAIVAQAAKAGISVDELKTKLPQYNDAMAGAKVQTQDAAAAIAGATGAIDQTKTAFDTATAAVDGTASAMDDATSAAEAYATAIRNLNQPQLDLREAENAVAEAYKTAKNRLDEAKKSTDKHAMSMSASSEAGRENRRAIDAVASAELGRIDALNASGAPEAALQDRLEASRSRLYDVALAYYGSESKARAYVDAVMGIPASKTTTVTAYTAAARANIDGVAGALTRIDGKKAYTYVYTVYKPIGTPGGWSTRGGRVAAEGGVIEPKHRFADSGGIMVNSGRSVARVPQVLSGSGGVYWQEPETDWEGYVSGKPGARKRSQQVMMQIAPRLGLRVTPAADGQLFTSGGSAAGGLGEVRLSDEDRQLLLAVARRPIQIDGEPVTRAVQSRLAGATRDRG